MTKSSRQSPRSEKADFPEQKNGEKPSDIVVFVDEATMDDAGISLFQRVAGALGGKVVLVHVQCRPDNGQAPVDPVEWDIRKQQSQKWLDDLIQCADAEGAPCEAQLLEGHCRSQIKSFLGQHPGAIAAMLRPQGEKGWMLSEIAWGVLRSPGAGVLMIPQNAQAGRKATYERILVPLDGSVRAENALPKAVLLAKAEAAELVLCHVAPHPGLSAFGVTDQEAENLHELVSKRNAKAAKNYLARISSRLAQKGLKISVRISNDGVASTGDARRSLIDLITREKADFVVMTTHGESGHKDVPTGDVARYILERADIPVLLVRPGNGRQGNHVFGKLSSEGVRQPVGTD